MKKLLFSLIACWLISACSEKKSEVAFDKSEAVALASPSAMEEPPNSTSSLPPSPAPTAPQSTGKKIIHTANLRFKVEDLKKAESALKAQIQAIGGYIANANQNRQSGNLENNWTVRIPAVKFDTFIGNVEKESVYTDSKNISAEDVTAEYVDNALRGCLKFHESENRLVNLSCQTINLQSHVSIRFNRFSVAKYQR